MVRAGWQTQSARERVRETAVPESPSGTRRPPLAQWVGTGKIVVDSCCDLSPELGHELDAATVPLTMRLGDREVVDDGALDLPRFMGDMDRCAEPAGSASPSPAAWQAAFDHPEPSYAVTLSSKLSGSYASAMLGKQLAEEAGSGPVHVFDSKSASAGETLIALKLRDLIGAGLERQAVIRETEAFIDSMKTYFVLERYDNLQKNGRLGKVAGRLITAMNIKLVMGADGDGQIALFAKPRGVERMLDKLIELIRASGRPTRGERLVISHCNNRPLAETLRDRVRDAFQFAEIHVVHTRGISSLYADNGGIVMAF